MASPANQRESGSRLFPTIMLLLCGSELALGLYSLLHHALWSHGPDCYATAGVLLIVAGLLTARVAHATWFEPALSSHVRGMWLTRCVLVGGCVSYAIALCVAPLPGAECVLAAALAWWTGLILLPLTANPQTLDRWRKLIESRKPKRIGLAVYHALLAVVIAEGMLRGFRLVRDFDFLTLALADKRAPAANRQNSRPGVLRVALVTGLTGAGAANAATAWHEPDAFCGALDVLHIDASSDRGTAQAWHQDLANFEPDLILGVLALDEGLHPATAAPGLLDWRSLETVRSITIGLQSLGLAPAVSRQCERIAPQAERELARLAVCRTPLDASAKNQWQRTLATLDVFVAECRPLDARVALVVVPAGFQVNRALCNKLRERAGYEPRELDLALPQRRLAVYAAERRLELLDLMPYLQASADPVYRLQDARWNEQGKLIAARALGGWIESQYSGVAARAQLTRGD